MGLSTTVGQVTLLALSLPLGGSHIGERTNRGNSRTRCAIGSTKVALSKPSGVTLWTSAAVSTHAPAPGCSSSRCPLRAARAGTLLGKLPTLHGPGRGSPCRGSTEPPLTVAAPLPLFWSKHLQEHSVGRQQ
eukprot:10014441-Lingulodinium_polyedra.AAC.1